MDTVKKSAAKRLADAGYENVIVFEDRSYDDALIGVSACGRAIYDYDRMIEGLKKHDRLSEAAAFEWVEYNTIQASEYVENAPIIMHAI